MATDITPVSAFTTSIPVIDDGDAANRATMVAQLQPLANRTEYLNDNKVKTVAAAESDLQDASAISLEYPQPFVIGDFSNFLWGGGGASGAVGAGFKQGASAGSGDYARILLSDLPQQGTLTAIKVTLKGASGHGGLPGNMPVATIGRMLRATATALFDNYGTATDPAASVVAYEAAHEFTVTPTAPIDLSARAQLCLHVRGEYGSGAVDNLIVAAVVAVITPAKVTP